MIIMMVDTTRMDDKLPGVKMKDIAAGKQKSVYWSKESLKDRKSIKTL